jgi:hypothetical protein
MEEDKWRFPQYNENRVHKPMINNKNKISFLTSKFRNFSKLKHLFNIQNLCIQLFLLKNFRHSKQESPKEFRFPTEIAEIHKKHAFNQKTFPNLFLENVSLQNLPF